MKRNKIIATLLILIGFGSCAPRPSKSKAPKQITLDVEMKYDSVRMITVAYGAPYNNFNLRPAHKPVVPENLDIPTPSTNTGPTLPKPE
jgi:hypothetical protein